MRYPVFLKIAVVGALLPLMPQAAWPEDWEQVLKAAKQEGKVAVIGFLAQEVRAALTEPFEKKYGIPVDYLSSQGPEVPPRLSTERRAGKYLWDIFVGGTTTSLTSLIPMKTLDPLETTFILPEVSEARHWRGGSHEFVDEGRQILVMILRQRGTLFVNPQLLDPKKLRSYKDLLEPQWKGKMVLHDPRIAGPGQATFTFFYLHPQLGPNFIRALARQEPLILREFRQEADAVGQGRYPILIGGNEATVEQLVKQGVSLAFVEPRQLKEGSDISPGFGAVSLINRAPNPNAAKVYVNWLLSREGQTAFSRATGYVSTRVDVPTDHVFPWRVPLPGAIKTYTQEAMNVKEPLLALLKEVLGR